MFKIFQIKMKIHLTGYRFVLVLGAYLVIYAILPSTSYPAEIDAIIIGSETDVNAADANTKIFTGNEQNDNVLAAGAVGLGVGIGGVLLAQAIFDKPNCRRRRFGDLGGLFGGNKDCNRAPAYPSRPRPPHHGGGGYREPRPDRPYRPPPSYYDAPQRPYRPYQEPYRPTRPYKEPYRPQRPYDNSYHSPSYEEPHRPYRTTKRPYREPSRPAQSYREPHRPAQQYREPARPAQQYREPATSYQNPKPDYQKPAVYRPPASHHESASPYYPDRPIRGRTGAVEDSNNEVDKEEKTKKLTNESNNTGEVLSGRVRFLD